MLLTPRDTLYAVLSTVKAMATHINFTVYKQRAWRDERSQCAWDSIEIFEIIF